MTGGRTVFLALDGCHGTGTSTHADALAEALRAELLAWALGVLRERTGL